MVLVTPLRLVRKASTLTQRLSSLSLSLFALLCLGLGAGAVLPSRAGALPHPSFGMDGLGLYRTVYPWCSGVCSSGRVPLEETS